MVKTSTPPLWLALSGAALLSLTSCSKENLTPESSDAQGALPGTSVGSGTPIAGQYIVVLKDDATTSKRPSGTKLSFDQAIAQVRETTQPLLRQYGVAGSNVLQTYGTVLQGAAVRLTEQQAADLRRDPRVEYVEQDQLLAVGPTQAAVSAAAAQTTPYGISRVGAGNGAGRTAWVIDTGIDLTHPDLVVDVNRSRSFVSGVTSPNDGNGHGTHVAGTIAARNTGVGVVGVAYGATVVAVRVLGADGSGSNSGVIAGVDYVGANGSAGDVANMSLGGGTSTALDNAVRNASARVLFALAAGNESTVATSSSPGRVNGTNIFTISAMNSSDSWASYSNYGNPPVDYCMPGSSVYSTYIGGGYATLSGTSMATPHMAGVLLLRGKNFTTSGRVRNDPDGNADPIAHL